MIHLMIDGQQVEVEEGTTILQAAKQAAIHIPTLCYHEDLSIKAVCRICVVEVEGMRQLQASCSTPSSELPGLREKRKMRSAAGGAGSGNASGCEIRYPAAEPAG